MSQLAASEKKALRRQAHNLKPSIQMGQNGLTKEIVKQFDLHIAKRELAKVKLPDIDRDERKELATELARQTSAELVQLIGRSATFYRESSSN